MLPGVIRHTSKIIATHILSTQLHDSSCAQSQNSHRCTIKTEIEQRWRSGCSSSPTAELQWSLSPLVCSSRLALAFRAPSLLRLRRLRTPHRLRRPLPLRQAPPRLLRSPATLRTTSSGSRTAVSSPRPSAAPSVPRFSVLRTSRLISRTRTFSRRPRPTMALCMFFPRSVCARWLTPVSANSGNAKWPFGLSSNRLQTGGWARQQNSQ